VGLLNLPADLRFRGLVGTGGIGHGSFFALEGNETLGREESRSGRFLDRRDYCKLHIISHYLKVLLGDAFAVCPVGRIGDDDAGSALRSEMGGVGIDLRFVRQVPGAPTLYSFCFLYPDGSGGNLTSGDSASANVNAEAVREAVPVMKDLGRSGIALAVPEVPLAARRALLESAASHGLFRAASFTTEEMPEARKTGLMGMADLCAMNLEEAAAAGGIDPSMADAMAPLDAAREAAERIWRQHPGLVLSITAGSAGSWCGDSSGLAFDPALAVKVEGTSGAGDAHFSGLLAGLATGLALDEAQQLATVVAAASVTSVHTIHPSLTTELLRSVKGLRARASARLGALLDTRIVRP
jgi:ribokinase